MGKCWLWRQLIPYFCYCLSCIYPKWWVYTFLFVVRGLILAKTSGQNHYRTSDDILQEAASKLGSVEGDSQISVPQLRDDLIHFCTLECTRNALPKLCEVKGDSLCFPQEWCLYGYATEVSSDIVVYRYSFSKTIGYLRAKVMHLEKSTAFDALRTVTRNLAKDCLMDDGQECLLKRGW